MFEQYFNQGAQLRLIRVEMGFSQLDLEVAADLSFGTISRIENNRINPTKETLLKIALALDLSSLQTTKLFGIPDVLSEVRNVTKQSAYSNRLSNSI